MERDWVNYYELTKNSPPRKLLVRALEYVTDRDCAFDLGAGALNESIYLLGEQFKRVVAIDVRPVAAELAATLPSEHFEYVISSLEEYQFPHGVVDLANAQYSLPFVKPEYFDNVWEKIGKSLKTGGIFVGQLFGDRDEWRRHVDMTFHTEDQARRLLADFDLLSFREDEEDRPTSEGQMKHWHVFHFIARK